jgi:ubiquitin-protein ligase
MASRAFKRIAKEISDLNKDAKDLAENGLYTYVNDENMKDVYALFIGREKTPYHHGFYFIKFTYPEDYPMNPPKAFYATQGHIAGNGGVRFNPNLYTCGKVCLSMLNTWQGPGWVPTNTIVNVFMAIQALVLHEVPLHNEPGYANHPVSDPVVQSYNRLIEYANYNIGIYEMLNHPPKGFEVFLPIMEKYFVENFNGIISNIQEIKAKYKEADIRCGAYGQCNVKPNYDATIQKLSEKYGILTNGTATSVTPSIQLDTASAGAAITVTSKEEVVPETVFKKVVSKKPASKSKTSTTMNYDGFVDAAAAVSEVDDIEIANQIAIAKLLEEDDKELAKSKN